LAQFSPVPTAPGTSVLVTPGWRRYCGIRAGDYFRQVAAGRGKRGQADSEGPIRAWPAE